MSTIDRPPTPTAAPAITSTIRALAPSLVRSEALVAALIVDRPAEVVDWSVAQMAATAGVSPATVVRACQSLGFNGFNGLRDALRQPPAAVPAGDEAERALATVRAVYGAGARQLDATLALIDGATIDRAVTALTHAPRVLVSALNDLAALGQYAVFRFATIGRHAEAPSDPVTLTAVARLLHPGDVLISISHSGANALTQRIAATAHTAGATVLAITGFARSPMAEIADIALVLGVGEADVALTARAEIRVSQLLMIDALRGAVADRLAEEAVAAQVAAMDGAREFVHRRDGAGG